MIRNMTLKDIDQVMLIEDASFKDGHYSKDQMLYELNENPFTKLLVNEDNYKINGFLIYMETFNSASVVQIGVDPKFRKQGIASNLLNHMVNALKSKGYGEIENITLEVRENNVAAHNLYLKNEFKDIVIKKKYYDNGDNAIYMGRVLL